MFKEEKFRFELENYKIDSGSVGRAVIFNNETFIDPGKEKREGTQKDATDLKATLEAMGFAVDPPYNDLTQVEAIQACRGSNEEKGALENKSKSMSYCSLQENSEGVVIPAGADFFICYASSEGFVARRHPNHGSPFIQAFVKAANYFITHQNPQMDFVSLITLVKENIAKLYYNEEKILQMPNTISSLRKRIYFPKLCYKSEPEGDKDN